MSETKARKRTKGEKKERKSIPVILVYSAPCMSYSADLPGKKSNNKQNTTKAESKSKKARKKECNGTTDRRQSLKQ